MVQAVRRLLWILGIVVAVVAAVLVALWSGVVFRLPGGLTVNFPGFSGDPMPDDVLRQRIRLPAGFSISTYAAGVPSARMLRFTPRGDLLVSSPPQGKVYLLEADADGDGAADGVVELLSGLDRPHGLDLHDGWLYVAETGAVARVRFDAAERRPSGDVERVVTGIPAGGNHWTRTVRVGPDGWIYLSIGSSCNVCIEDDPRRAAIVRYRLDGSDEQVYASGLRNAVGFAWRPETGELYATDNGRDLLGDDFPPCELNVVVEGAFYGWPHANGDRVPDPNYGKGERERIAASIPPVHGFAAHTAPLGIAFYDAEAFPERYRGAAFVALHGSWNRSTKIGYEVVGLFFEADGSVREEAFAKGFEIDEKVHGRPVDVAVGPDGALYVSDDFTGSVYRIVYGEAPAARRAAPVPAATVVGARTGAQETAEVVVGEGAAGADRRAELAPEEILAVSSRGAGLFAASGCAACHIEGHQTGGETLKPLAGLAARYTVDSLAVFLAAPQPPMPLYPFDEQQRRDLAVHLLAAHP